MKGMESVLKRLDAIEKKLDRPGKGKKDHDYLDDGPTTKPSMENPDHEDTGKKKKSVGIMIAMLKARKK